MSRQAMIIDMDRCVGCGACAVACDAEWELPEGVRRAWVEPLWPVPAKGQVVFTHFLGQCNHCSDAPCVPACPTGATFRDAKGRVRVDDKACIRCGYCVSACPYGARMLRPEGGRLEKCDFCAPLVDAGLIPACVRTCPSGARVFGDLDDRDGQVARHFRTHRVERLETSAVAVQPNVYYSGRKDVLERIRLSHPPRPAGLHPPLPGRLLRDLLKPAFMAMLALGALGVAATFLRQLLRGEGDDASGHGGAEAGPEVGEVHRHDAVILWLHWFNALAWLFQASTGFALLGRTAYSVTPPFFNDAMLSVFGSGATMLRAHIVVGLIWAVVLVMYGVFGFKRYLVPFLAGLRLRPDDLRWIRTRSGNIFRRSEQPLPPQDKYNAGQKLCGMAVSLGTFVVASTGLVLYFLPGSGAIVQWAIPLHFAAAAGVVLAILIHVTVVTLLPAERPALWSMFTGKISSRYAREHNARWWNGLKDK